MVVNFVFFKVCLECRIQQISYLAEARCIAARCLRAARECPTTVQTAPTARAGGRPLARSCANYQATTQVTTRPRPQSGAHGTRLKRVHRIFPFLGSGENGGADGGRVIVAGGHKFVRLVAFGSALFVTVYDCRSTGSCFSDTPLVDKTRRLSDQAMSLLSWVVLL